MTSSLQPVVCTLTDRAAETQLVEWADLQRLSLRTEPLAAGVEMTFRAGHAARIVDLAEREAACCAFLNIDTSLVSDEITLRITSDNPDAIGVIAELAGRDLS